MAKNELPGEPLTKRSNNARRSKGEDTSTSPIGMEQLHAFEEGRKVFGSASGKMAVGQGVHAKINQRALEKNMNDNEQMSPPQWLGRPIVSPEHVQDLETRAAINEFHSRMPRAQAEAKAHEDYVRDQRETAAAHHLKGMRAASAVGNHEDAQKHWMMYDLHMKGLGQQSIGPVTPEIEKRMLEDQKPVYRFKAHKGDLYALSSPSKETAPADEQPIQKGEVIPFPSKPTYQGATLSLGPNAPPPEARELPKGYRDGEERTYQCGTCGDKAKVWADPGAHEPFIEHCRKCGKDSRWSPTIHMVKSEAKQCKWRLGERRCKRMVSEGYCHDHKDHWANKINQEQAMNKTEIAQELLTGLKGLLERLEKNGDLGGLKMPPASAATPQLHSTVEGFMQGLKALPRDPAARGKFITQHMNHAPFIAALKQHPQGPAVHQMLTQHMNSAANAGFKAGKTVALAK